MVPDRRRLDQLFCVSSRRTQTNAKNSGRWKGQQDQEGVGWTFRHRTPLAGESVADFYVRTTEYWNVEAGKTVGQAAADRGDAMSSKELKREGFSLARKRYDELKPVLERLEELENMQQDKEEKKAKKKSEKKPKKDRLR